MNPTISHYDQVIPLGEMIEQLKILNERGYKILEPIGEGQTRAAYKVLYEKGPVRRVRVLKLPKTELDPTSVTTRINLGKGDLNKREVLTLNQIRNPHIVEIYEAFSLPNGETATVEEWYDALSLEDLVRISGPLSEEQFKTVFSQVLEGLSFLHGTEELYHRDLKPSNILVGRKDLFVKIADLQNAVRRRDIQDSMLPTRGGTAYTDPRVLNALLEGRATHCDLRSELYALGATMYYALTGEDLWGYSLVPREGGKEIHIGDDIVSIALEEEGVYSTLIDLGDHDRKVKKKIKTLPRKQKQLLEPLLLLEPEYLFTTYAPEYAHNRLREVFDSATRKTRVDWRKVREHTLWGTIGAACLTGLIGGAGLLQWQSSVVVEPTLIDALKSTNFQDWDLNYLQDAVDGAMLDVLRPYFVEVSENRTRLEAFYEAQVRGVHSVTAVSGVSNRLTFALLESIILTPEEEIGDQYGYQRYKFSLVPKEFMDRWLGPYSSVASRGVVTFPTQWQTIGGATHYMKKCLIAEDDLPDVFACYFTGPGDLARAQGATMSSTYFPSLVVQQRWVNGHYEEYDEHDQPIRNRWGYRTALPQVEQDLINRATALYLVMDNTGSLHPEAIAEDGSINQEVLQNKIP